MRKSMFLLGAACAPIFLGGCVGSGPATEQGAVTGGTIGAVAGGIIGNNSRGGDTVGGALVGAAVGAIAGGVIGNSVDQQRGTLYDSPDSRGYRRAVVAQQPPPPPPAPAET